VWLVLGGGCGFGLGGEKTTASEPGSGSEARGPFAKRQQYLRRPKWGRKKELPRPRLELGEREVSP